VHRQRELVAHQAEAQLLGRTQLALVVFDQRGILDRLRAGLEEAVGIDRARNGVEPRVGDHLLELFGELVGNVRKLAEVLEADDLDVRTQVALGHFGQQRIKLELSGQVLVGKGIERNAGLRAGCGRGHDCRSSLRQLRQ
jgi:hypothetical protein